VNVTALNCGALPSLGSGESHAAAITVSATNRDVFLMGLLTMRKTGTAFPRL
jgi:hypothetical protein